MEHKYVRFEKLGFMLWPKTDDIWHLYVARLASFATGPILSAGFCVIESGQARCYGRSESIHIGSRPDDSDALTAQLGL